MKKIIMMVMIAGISLLVLASCSQRTALLQDNTDTAVQAPQTSEAFAPAEEPSGNDTAVTEQADEDIVKPAEIVQISPEEAYNMIMEDEDVFLLDVRSQAEYDEGYIEGATLIPVDELEARLDEVPKDKKIVVYCRSGSRSMAAADILVSNGYEQVYNISGGIIAWSGAGLPVIE